MAEADSKSKNKLRVGIFCEMGKHRSVAFVEELGRMTRKEGWKIEVLHRDIGKNRRDGKRKKTRGSLRYEMASEDE